MTTELQAFLLMVAIGLALIVVVSIALGVGSLMIALLSERAAKWWLLFDLHLFLDRLLGIAEEINGANRCPTYLYRWTIAKFRGKRGIYLHHFVGDDWSLDLHDHPKRFISIGLKGWYIEDTPVPVSSMDDGELDDVIISSTIYRAPWIRSFPATHIHRLRVPSKNCWTLVIVLKAQREWGFWPEGKFQHWKEYVMTRGGRADKMKACE